MKHSNPSGVTRRQAALGLLAVPEGSRGSYELIGKAIGK